jgi:hypothetical protein
MVLLEFRSMPDFSTVCISALDFLGDAMNCKGSVLSTIDCNEASWYDSRDEVIESKPGSDGFHEEDLSSRYDSLLDSTQSLSSSLSNLLHDSSQRRGQHSMSTSRIAEDEIFRLKNSPQTTSCHELPFNKLNRCTAWIQDDYSFESEHLREESRIESVRIVHWEDRLNEFDSINMKNGCGIFRPSHITIEAGRGFLGSCRLHRCSAWSLDDDSSLVVDDNVSSARRESRSESNQVYTVHWDELVQGEIQ